MGPAEAEEGLLPVSIQVCLAFSASNTPLAEQVGCIC